MVLTGGGRDLVLGEWARRLTVAVDVLQSPGTTFVSSDGADAVVVVVRFGEACAPAPAPALARLREPAPHLPLDVGSVTAQVSALGPSPIGVAALGYPDTPTTSPTGDAVDGADNATMSELRLRCSDDDWDESGLASMSPRWVSHTADGHPAALAGYEPWGAHITHLGVIADPVRR